MLKFEKWEWEDPEYYDEFAVILPSGNEILFPYDEQDQEFWMAVSLLIAEAPGLLEACEKSCTFVDRIIAYNVYRNAPSPPEVLELRAELETVIACAKGES